MLALVLDPLPVRLLAGLRFRLFPSLGASGVQLASV